MSRALSRLLLALLLGMVLLLPSRAWAGPVSWKEVPATSEGRQWWDEGSLRRNRAGHLTVLSRFQAAPESAAETPSGVPVSEADAGPRPEAAPAGSLPPGLDQRSAAARTAPPISRLYVMELDCDQSLYRDISVNGLPQFGASWQPTGSDDLTAEVLRQACAAEAA
jgi:hypothetical protein